MNPQSSSHPADQTLSRFSLGKLDAELSVSIREHLLVCPDCQARVTEISSAGRLARTRAAYDDPDERSSGPVNRNQPSPGAIERDADGPPLDTLPPGLADNPDYRIIRELGRGGMGVVYLAHNNLLGRDEVLKVVSRHLVQRKGVVDRFGREIRSAARLQHPNIVHAYSAFRIGDSMAFAMEYVDGRDLANLVKSDGPLPVAHACYYVFQAALALQHAHEQGMVHRDIKPGNLMLTVKGGKAVVKVLDFGLAKATRESPLDGRLTHEGQMLGTPDYIAPEQIRNAQSAGIRADIYSLGCSLYYLLTGGPPFDAPSLYDVLQAHFSMDAQPLNAIRTDVSAPLAALVGKLMAKDPEQRFQSPAQVAEALKPFFENEEASSVDFTRITRPFLAKKTPAEAARAKELTIGPESTVSESDPPRAPDRTPKLDETAQSQWGQETLEEAGNAELARDAGAVARWQPGKHASWIWPSAAVAVLLGLFAAWKGGLFDPGTKNERQDGDRGSGQAERLASATDRDLPSPPSAQIRNSAGRSNSEQSPAASEPSITEKALTTAESAGTRAKTIARETHRPGSASSEKTAASGTPLPSPFEDGPGRTVVRNGPFQSVWSLALTRDGRVLVSGHNGSIRAWDLIAGRERFNIATGRTVRRVDITPDGKTIVSAEYRLLDGKTPVDNVVVVRDGATGAARHVMTGSGSGLNGISVSPDGKTVASTSWVESEIRVWDAERGIQIHTLTGHTKTVFEVVFRSDGKVLASAGDTTVRLWNVERGVPLRVLQGHTNAVECVAFRPDGQEVASGGYDNTARLWDPLTGEALATFEHDRPVLAVAFSPDGKTMATASARWADVNYKEDPARVELWSLAERQPTATFPQQPAQIFDLAFTPDGKSLLTANLYGIITSWDLTKFNNSRRD